MKLTELLNEDWYTADDMEELYQKIKKVVKDKDLRERILAAFNGILGDERADDDDMEELFQEIKKIVKDKGLRNKILSIIQKA
jgi:predicted sulfurtransferase